MSGVEEARQALETATQRCVDAVWTAEVARSRFDDRIAWAGMMGLDAMHALIQQAHAAITEATGQWTQAGDVCATAAATLATVEQTPNRRDLAGLLTAARARLDGARTAAGVAAGRVGDAAAHVVETEIGDLTTAATEAVAVGETADVAIDAAVRVLDCLRQRVEIASTTHDGGDVSATRRQQAMAEQMSVGDPSGQRETASAAVQRAAKTIPVWQRKTPTQGLAWLDEDGEPVEFVSGRDRSAGEGLRPEYAARIVTTDHVEGKLAARMRQPGGPVRVTAVINKDPCGGPIGCDATLPHIIPCDSIVSLYVRDEVGVRHFGTYHGTGRGLA